jgi:hypothetical protein
MLSRGGGFHPLAFPRFSRTRAFSTFKKQPFTKAGLRSNNAADPKARRHSQLRTPEKKPQPTTRKMADDKAILAGKYPAKSHARRVVEWMRKKNPSVGGVLYLEGQKTRMIEDNDESMPFRLVLYFFSRPLINPSAPGNVDISTT